MESGSHVRVGVDLHADTRLLFSMEILGLSAQDLDERIQKELDENPVVEEGVAPDEWVRAIATDPVPGAGLTRSGHEDIDDVAERIAAPDEALADHLDRQVGLLSLPAAEDRAARCIVQSLDERGYLVETDEQIAQAARCSIDEAGRARSEVQRLDPAGCASRTLEECFRAQMVDKDFDPDDAARIVALVGSHLSELKVGRLPSIARRLDITESEVVRLVELLRGLDPAPGRLFSSDRTTWVVPDAAFVKKFGRWEVIIRCCHANRMRLTQNYRALLKSASHEARAFLLDRLRRARALLGAVANRDATIRQVLGVIASRQVGFLENGPAFLQPLTHEDLALQIGVHATTVGRAIRGKYVETPFGSRPLEYFFPEGIAQKGGEELSSKAIQDHIRRIIRAENPDAPLSDQAITDLLASEGVRVSRRAVRNYRDQLGVANSADRRGARRLRTAMA